MKVIAKSERGFIVEMTDDEIAHAAGYSGTYTNAWETANGNRREPRIGMIYNVGAAYNFHHRITANQDKAKEAAATLRALAGLLDGAMPDVVVPPPTDAAAQ